MAPNDPPWITFTATAMQKIAPQFMPHVERAPQFIEAIQRAKHDHKGHDRQVTITQRLETFDNDPFLLYTCLWYAVSEGVAVTFLPL
ncbi:MAG: hypothetical protein JO250_20735 [Armatimonadetes bacterium]|nr:hypothetical protein [Armatimonadota bacterium]